MNRNVALLAGAAAGAVGALLLRRRARPAVGSADGGVDPRAEELRRKLAQAREEAADAEEFEAAGMGPETLVEEPTAVTPPPDLPPATDVAPPADPTPPPEAAPAADVDEERRRVHDQARAAADEMRRGGGTEQA